MHECSVENNASRHWPYVCEWSVHPMEPPLHQNTHNVANSLHMFISDCTNLCDFQTINLHRQFKHFLGTLFELVDQVSIGICEL